MARNQRQYDKEYKIQAIKLAKEIGINKAARELGIASSTLSHLEQYPQSAAMCWYCSYRVPSHLAYCKERI